MPVISGSCCGTVWYCTPAGLVEVAVGTAPPAGFTGGPWATAAEAASCPMPCSGCPNGLIIPTTLKLRFSAKTGEAVYLPDTQALELVTALPSGMLWKFIGAGTYLSTFDFNYFINYGHSWPSEERVCAAFGIQCLPQGGFTMNYGGSVCDADVSGYGGPLFGYTGVGPARPCNLFESSGSVLLGNITRLVRGFPSSVDISIEW